MHLITNPQIPSQGRSVCLWLRLGFNSRHLINPYPSTYCGVRPCYRWMCLKCAWRRGAWMALFWVRGIKWLWGSEAVAEGCWQRCQCSSGARWGLPAWAQGPACPGCVAGSKLRSTHLWFHFSADLIATDFYKTLSSKGEISVTGTVLFMGKDSVGWSSQ